MPDRIKVDQERWKSVESWLDMYGAEILIFLQKQVESSSTAEIGLEEVFVEAYRRRRKVEKSGEVRGWLYRQARRWAEVHRDRVTFERSLETRVSSPTPVSSSKEDDQRAIEESAIPTATERVSDRPSPHSSHGDESTDESSSESGVSEKYKLPALVRARILHRLWATTAQIAAERRHQGPLWTRYGVAATIVIGLGAVAYGTYKPNTSSFAPIRVATTQSTLPAPLGNLPVDVLGQFQLQSTTSIDLSHTSVGEKNLYVATYSMPSGGPEVSITKYPFTQTGKRAPSVSSKSRSTAFFIHLTVPTPLGNARKNPQRSSASSSQGSANVGWEVGRWRFTVTGHWGVLIVPWIWSHDSSRSVIQLYTVYLPTGKSSLAKVLSTQTSLRENYVVAVGEGRLVVQGAFRGSSKSGTVSMVGLPVEVYTLSGTNPLYALGVPQEIAAPFGWMSRPAVSAGGVVFQGTPGQETVANGSNELWYELSWSGQLSKLLGPPVDGQPHWFVEGSNSSRYWVETTPQVGGGRGGLQVLMAPLISANSSAAEPAMTLDGTVMGFSVSGRDLIWIQTEGGIPQLVIAQVH